MQDLIESYGRTERQKVKQRLAEKHFLAKDIAQYVSLILSDSKDSKVMELWDYFPDLYKDEGIEAAQKIQEQEIAEYKAQMIDFALRHNHSRLGGEKNWKA